ncbi:MAG: transketolase [Candidatus Eisenbacteria bacterium]|nr:transketolase [Candidatus Eisenbacteria bacterium]
MTKDANLDQLCINTIRFLSVDAVQKAESGHPGTPLGAAPMAYVLWTRYLRHNPANPDWFDRDRFVLSAGHASMLLYSLLHLTGYDVSMEEIQRFRQWGSLTPGHPERVHTPGVEVTTGPLGQGFGNGVGMAIAEKSLAARYNRPGHEVINHFTYALCSDGDIMEGVAAEAASLAGHLKLGKLIYFYDANQMSLSAATNLTLSESVAERFNAYGWHTQKIDDGNDLDAIDEALGRAQAEEERPSLIIVRSHIGFGSPNMQDTYQAHGKPLGEEEVALTKKNLGWPDDKTFTIPDEARDHFRRALDLGKRREADWKSRCDKFREEYPELEDELTQVIKGELPPNWHEDIPAFPAEDGKIATRSASQKVMNAIAHRLPAFLGGAADLAASTKTDLENLGDFEPPEYAENDRQGAAGGDWDYTGRNLHFGVREHAMGAIANGMAAHGGVIPFVSTFLIFSDYMRPTIRLASLMELPVKYVYTHDSIAVGEDGPTHQPVEHLASLRAVPGLVVIRPADANETAAAWKVAIESQDHPVALVLTRQKLPVLDRKELAAADELRRGAYILKDAATGEPDLILIATGSEVALALEAREKLEGDGVATRVVSMPSWELFDRQPEKYRASVLPRSVKARLAVEAASELGWHKYIGAQGRIIGVDRFGASAYGETVMQEYGYSVENVYRQAKALLES